MHLIRSRDAFDRERVFKNRDLFFLALKDVPLPIMVGDADGLAGSVRNLDARLKEVNIAHEYKEMPGLDRGGIIMGSMPDLFKFFGQHTKPTSK